MLGHSWGGMLAMQYGTTQPEGLISLVVESSPPSVPAWMGELAKLRAELPPEVAVMFNPLAAGLSWASTIPRTGPSDRVVILGAGQRGLCCVIAARAAGARDRRAHRPGRPRAARGTRQAPGAAD